MSKVAVVLLAGTEGLEALGRMANALFTVQEFKEAGDDVKLVLDGAGVQWVAELAKADHKYYELYQQTRDCIDGVCEYCAKAFQVTDAVEAEGLSYAVDNQGHPSFRQLTQDGYQVITF